MQPGQPPPNQQFIQVDVNQLKQVIQGIRFRLNLVNQHREIRQELVGNLRSDAIAADLVNVVGPIIVETLAHMFEIEAATYQAEQDALQIQLEHHEEILRHASSGLVVPSSGLGRRQ